MLDREFIDLQEALAGEYSLERELGRGGMGIVYLAREVQLDRLVAIKVLPQALSQRSDVRDRFLREARMAASLSHPHIVPIYRVGEARGFVFFVMAFVNGETLGERLRSRGPLPIAATTRLLREVTWALSYAHGRGIVHRDIKPDNILIEAETGRALVSDFGIARGAAETEITDPGRVMGTAHFMSPEQASSEALDGRSDLYSLGVVAYLALSGKLPFDAPSVPALLAKHLSVAPPSLATVAPDVPRSLVSVIDRCLQKNANDRWASGEALAEALESASAPARAKLPMALRVWAQSEDPMRPAYMAWSGIFTITLIFNPRRDWITLGLDLLPLIPIVVFHARKSYKALSAGYTLRDLRAALASWRSERREELAFDSTANEPVWARVMRVLTYASGAGALALFPILRHPHNMSQAIALASTIGGAIVAFTASNAFGVRLISPSFRSNLIGGIRSAIWNSRVGEWAAKLLTPRKRSGLAQLDYRPTEMALGLAVEELYASLPKAYRDDLPDLPDVVRRLEMHAAAARARVDELTALMALGDRDASASSDTSAAVAARDAAKRELADSVTALEAVRLDLLRLHAGAVDLKPITMVLEAARELGEQLDRLNDAQREVDDLARTLPPDLRPHTPV
ncbi:MAG TPA: serine/threonine-protein kinase [Gemmatimonadaceae bacterium]|nr:serine/threonine-protein kinase [Gemmatimonadaceae bacterium]